MEIYLDYDLSPILDEFVEGVDDVKVKGSFWINDCGANLYNLSIFDENKWCWFCADYEVEEYGSLEEVLLGIQCDLDEYNPYDSFVSLAKGDFDVVSYPQNVSVEDLRGIAGSIKKAMVAIDKKCDSLLMELRGNRK